MSTDPWAAASAVATQSAPASNQTEPDSLAGAYSDEPAESDLLFGGSGAAAPSLFNKTHFLGSERSGIITKAPYDQHDRVYKTGELKYWNDGKDMNEEGKVPAWVISPVSKNTGKPNRPVKSAVVELSTDYRMELGEWGALERDPAAFASFEDDGSRNFVASSQGLKALRDAVSKSGARSGKELVGMRLTVKRAGQKPNAKGNASWILEITLSRP